MGVTIEPKQFRTDMTDTVPEEDVPTETVLADEDGVEIPLCRTMSATMSQREVEVEIPLVQPQSSHKDVILETQHPEMSRQVSETRSATTSAIIPATTSDTMSGTLCQTMSATLSKSDGEVEIPLAQPTVPATEQTHDQLQGY